MSAHKNDLQTLFVASCLHEAKNQANHLMMHVEQLAELFSLSTDDPKFLPIKMDCHNLLHHLTQILQLYKSDQGYRLHREDIILEEFFEDIQLRHSHISLHAQTDSELTAVFDEQLIANVIDTAIYNAIQAGATKLALQARQVDSYLEIIIEDNGPGFPQDFLTQSFDHLSSSNLAEHRTGLGLYMAQKIMQAHVHHDQQGYLQVQNSSSMGGGKLSLYLP